MNSILNKNGKSILLAMVKGIQENKAYLGEVDGLIGDGDHGMNMNKGFTLFETRFKNQEFSFTEGLEELGTILFSEIGGSMGPIYGTILMDAASAGETFEEIGVKELRIMLQAGLAGLQEIVDAQVGDKTLVDTLSPAVDMLKMAEDSGLDMSTALEQMKQAARAGGILPRIWWQNSDVPAGLANVHAECWMQGQHPAVLFWNLWQMPC